MGVYMKLFYKILIIILFFPLSNAFAQLDLSHEFGISVGSVSMQTDYGERHDLPSSTLTSFGVAFSHYLSFYGSNYNWRNGASFFSDHFKLKSEVSFYFNNNLEHKGAYAAPGSTSADADELRAMKGTTKIFNVGTQLEYYFKNLEDYGLLFNDNEKFSPYISAGVQYNYFTPTLTSDLGDINTSGVLPQKYENNFFIEKDQTFSFTLSLGTRYKVNEIELVLDARWQYFLSDKIDGLDASVTGNKFNDTLIYFSFGAIIDLDLFTRRQF